MELLTQMASLAAGLSVRLLRAQKWQSVLNCLVSALQTLINHLCWQQLWISSNPHETPSTPSALLNIQHQGIGCAERMKMVWVGNVSGYTGLLWSVPHPWLSGEPRWPLGQQRKQSETKFILKRIQGWQDRQKGARLQGCFWALGNFTIKQPLSPSHL